MNFLHDQTDGFVRLDGTLRRLPILNAWKGSPQVFWVAPPFNAFAISFKVGKPDKSSYYNPLAMQCHPKRGLWKVSIPGTMLAEKCETCYKIALLDDQGVRHVCGEGILRVHSGTIPDSDDGPIMAEECYALFPDGKWRRVGVVTNALGEMTFSVAQEPTTPIAGQVFKHPYAFNKATGLYYAVTGFVDSVGEAYLAVSEGPSDGVETYAKDDATGFYYRVETSTDSIGEKTINVGEKR